LVGAHGFGTPCMEVYLINYFDTVLRDLACALMNIANGRWLYCALPVAPACARSH